MFRKASPPLSPLGTLLFGLLRVLGQPFLLAPPWAPWPPGCALGAIHQALQNERNQDFPVPLPPPLVRIPRIPTKQQQDGTALSRFFLSLLVHVSCVVPPCHPSRASPSSSGCCALPFLWCACGLWCARVCAPAFPEKKISVLFEWICLQTNPHAAHHTHTHGHALHTPACLARPRGLARVALSCAQRRRLRPVCLVPPRPPPPPLASCTTKTNQTHTPLSHPTTTEVSTLQTFNHPF